MIVHQALSYVKVYHSITEPMMWHACCDTKRCVNFSYNQSFSRYFFFNVKPTPKVTTIKINVAIIQKMFVAATAKLNIVKKNTAMIARIKKMD